MEVRIYCSWRYISRRSILSMELLGEFHYDISEEGFIFH